MSKKYYAIRVGKETGIFNKWDDCKDYVVGFSGAEYKSFKNKLDALNFMGNPFVVEEEIVEEEVEHEKEYETKHDEALLNSNKDNTVSIYTDGSWANTDNGNVYTGGWF